MVLVKLTREDQRSRSQPGFPFAKEKQEQEKRHEGNQKKERATSAMQIGMNPVGADSNTKLAENKNAKSIAQQTEGNDGQRDNQFA